MDDWLKTWKLDERQVRDRMYQLRATHAEPLIVIWDNGPAHGGDAIRAYLATPDVHLRLVRLPAYSPDFNPDEAIWGWSRDAVTANTCFGTKAKVQQHVGQFFRDVAHRTDEGLAEVEEEEQVGRQRGTDGVPFFLLADKYGVSGAQPAEVLANVIERVVELEAEEQRTLIPVGVPAAGAACSPDDPERCS